MWNGEFVVLESPGGGDWVLCLCSECFPVQEMQMQLLPKNKQSSQWLLEADTQQKNKKINKSDHGINANHIKNNLNTSNPPKKPK